MKAAFKERLTFFVILVSETSSKQVACNKFRNFETGWRGNPNNYRKNVDQIPSNKSFP